jgi:DNA repair protein RadC
MKIYNISLSYSLVREEPAQPLTRAALAVEYVKEVFSAHPEQEGLYAILLNNKNFPKGRVLISLGTATASLAHPREIFRAAILAGASGIILAHNHPSGDPSPSTADISITRQVREAGKIIGIELLDHIILGDAQQDPNNSGFYSFRDAGLV